MATESDELELNQVAATTLDDGDTTRDTFDGDEESRVINYKATEIKKMYREYFGSYQWKPPRRIGNNYFFCYRKKTIQLEQSTLQLISEGDQENVQVQVPRFAIPTLCGFVSSIPIMAMCCLVAYMEVSGLLTMKHVPFWKFKFLLCLLIAWGVYSCACVLTCNPGVDERVFYEREQKERRRYAVRLLREKGLLDDATKLDDVIQGEVGCANQQLPASRRRCAHCDIVRMPYTSHCGLCGICVQDLDHHCVFFGKCIARDNLGSFNSTICLFVVTMGYFVSLMVLDGIWAGPQSRNHSGLGDLSNSTYPYQNSTSISPPINSNITSTSNMTGHGL